MKTIKLLVSQAIPNMVIAESVYTFSNQLIIQEGTRLTDKIITRLKFYSIDRIRIYVPEDDSAPIPSDTQKKEMYFEKLKESEEFKVFNDQLLVTTDHLKETMQEMADGKVNIDLSALYEEVNEIVNSGRNGLHVFDMLHCMRDYDDHTYIHSINVALIAKVLGTWLNFSTSELELVTMCGLLHDIGKITIPHDILSKASTLTADEFNTVKAHAIRGYNILRPLNLNIHVKMAAMMHHERCDGTGYPMGLMGDQIDKYAKVIMIADVYDAMTCARVYRGPLCPFEVIHLFESEGLSKYEPAYIMTFFDHIAQLYLHSNVRLSDGRIGEIILMNRNSMTCPVVQVDGEFIDLSANHDLYITAVL